MNKKLFGSINVSSSSDPEKLAATVSGIIVSASSLIVFGAWKFLGITLVDAQVSAFATQVGLGTGAIWTLYGLIRKLVNRLSW